MSDETPDDLSDDALDADGQDVIEANDVPENDVPENDVPETEGVAAVATQLDPADDTWWRSAIFYQIYPRSFSDLDGDGIGDLAGVIDKLGYLELLGVDALWLSPIMRSPMADHGYDVSDPRDIDPLFGDLATFDELIAEAHDREIRVTMDLVPNHTSDQHQWFIDALAAGPGSPERARYIFRDGRGENGDEPPNNWVSIFGGPAWDRVTEADGTPGVTFSLETLVGEPTDAPWLLQIADDSSIYAVRQGGQMLRQFSSVGDLLSSRDMYAPVLAMTLLDRPNANPPGINPHGIHPPKA